jgi:general secretion pathway protein A
MDIRATWGLHSLPCTREIAVKHHFHLPFYDEALDALRTVVEQRQSAALIAPSGTGKTQLLRALTESLPEARYRVRYVKITDLSKRDICREIARAIGVEPAGSYPGLVRRVQERYAATLDTDGVRPVLLLDEAHDFRPDVLGVFRILTNFEMDSRLVLSVVLAGQPELAVMLRRDSLEAVARRLAHVATLRLLSREETSRYVAHRCTVAGATALPFDERALDAIYEIGKGNLRATDRLVVKGLEMAARVTSPVVDATHVIEARRVLWA